MPVKFKFRASDPLVNEYLSPDEISAIEYWQKSDAYDFEFHGGHTTGNPIYIRPRECDRDRSNVPKIDTLNKTRNSYIDTEKMANGEKLRVLRTSEQQELIAIVRNEWDALCKLASEYWKNHG